MTPMALGSFKFLPILVWRVVTIEMGHCMSFRIPFEGKRDSLIEDSQVSMPLRSARVSLGPT